MFAYSTLLATAIIVAMQAMKSCLSTITMIDCTADTKCSSSRRPAEHILQTRDSAADGSTMLMRLGCKHKFNYDVQDEDAVECYLSTCFVSGEPSLLHTMLHVSPT